MSSPTAAHKKIICYVAARLKCIITNDIERCPQPPLRGIFTYGHYRLPDKQLSAWSVTRHSVHFPDLLDA